MQKIISIILNGDPLPTLLMHVIRFIMPAKNKSLKRLLLLYWEGVFTDDLEVIKWSVIPKLDANGKLKQEMILVWYVSLLFRWSNPW